MSQTSVMVVEGERVAAMGIRTQLQRAGYLVPAIVSYGEDVVPQATEIDPDLVLMGLHLKGEIGGLEAARRLQAQSDIPVIYMLSSTDPDTEQQVKSAAIYGYLSRPLDDRELQATIEMALYKHGTDRELRACTMRVRQSHAALRLVGRLMDDACKGQGSRSLLRTACRELADILNAPYAVAVLLEPQAETAHLMGEFVLDGQRQSLDAHIKVDGTPLLQYALARGEPWVIEDIGQDPHVSWVIHRLPKDDAYSTLILPLVSDGAILGGLALTVTRTCGFGEDDVALGWTVVGQLADTIAHIEREITPGPARDREGHPVDEMEGLHKLASGIAHDLNNLLTTINGNASLLLYEKPDSEVSEMVQAILDAGERAADLTRQLVLATRKQAAALHAFCLNDVVEDMRDTLQHMVGKQISLQIWLAPDLRASQGDPALMREMIASLVDNAYDAMPRGGQLTIRTANVFLAETSNAFGLRAGPGEYVMLSVQDTGTGMSEDVQQHLFEPFFTTKRRGEGTGLGLVAVHRIVRQCSGAIEVESAEGQGTLFRIYLPCTRAQGQTQELPELRAPGQRGKETILLVEDDDSIFELTQRVLARSGYTLLTARDGLEAQHVAENHKGTIDLLLTDLTMPRMDGKTLAEGLIRMRPGLKVLLMSGYAGAVPSADGQGIEEMAFVQKPFRPQDLVQQVRAVLDHGPALGDLWSLERTGP